MARFALTIFASAFLLFQVQRTDCSLHSAVVWGCTIGLVNVHAVLSTGVTRGLQLCSRLESIFLRKRCRRSFHMIVLVSACLMLPIVPSDSLRPTGEESPVFPSFTCPFGNDWRTVFCGFHHGSAAAIMVFKILS